MEYTNEKPQQNRSVVYSIGALLLLALLVIGYVFFTTTDMQDNDVTDVTATSTEKTNSTSTTTVSATPTMQNEPNQEEGQNKVDLVLPTYLWKTYANTKHGFSFEYPADWKSTEEERGEYQFFVCLMPNDWSDISCPVSVLANQGVSLDVVYEFARQGFDELTVVETNTSVAGSSGTLIRVSGYAEEDAGYTRLVFFEYKGVVYDVRTINGGEDVFNHILATFK